MELVAANLTVLEDRHINLPDRPEIRGMIARVPHLLEVSDAAAASATAKKES